MVRQTRNIPQAKEDLVSDEEKAQAREYHENSDSLYHAGIRVGEEGFYDPEKGLQKQREPRSEVGPTPVLATDPGQPKIDPDGVVTKRSPSVDKSEIGVVRSGRKVRSTEE